MGNQQICYGKKFSPVSRSKGEQGAIITLCDLTPKNSCIGHSALDSCNGQTLSLVERALSLMRSQTGL